MAPHTDHFALYKTDCLDKVRVMERTQPDDDNPRRRLSPEQREAFDVAASPAERDAVIEGFRRAHVETALHEAVTAGRLGPAEAAGIFDRLARGGDPHALRRELRAAGVLIRRSANNRQDEGESSA